MSRVLRREWRSLARMRTAIILLAIVGTLSVIATELPQRALQPERVSDYITAHKMLGPFFDRLGLFSVYESWPLLAAVVLMYVSLSNCVITRGLALFRRWRRKLPRTPQFWGEAGSLVFHLSFFVLLAGVAYNLAGGFTAFVNVIEGDSVVESRSSYDQVEEGLLFNPIEHRGYEVKLDRFNAAYYADGRPSDFVSHVEVLDQGRKVKEQDIRVNEYMAYRDVKFYQANYGWAPVIQVTDPSGRKVFDAPVIFFGAQEFANGILKVPAAGPPGEQLGARMFFAPDVQGDSVNAHAGSANLVNPAVSFAFFKGDLHADRAANVYDLDVSGMKQLWTGALRQGETSVLPDGSRVTFARVDRYSGFQVTYAPGLPVIYTAFVLMLGGLLVRLYLRPLLEWRIRRQRLARQAAPVLDTPPALPAPKLDQSPGRSAPG
ncbi:MAG: cytochrome c biosis protein [Chloroflexota bacterium]|jgi:cytochrome c biogenesis protein|nr:cytochrome c biosis protein [Chloroflexota bacterium]